MEVIEQGLKELTKRHADLLESIHQMETDLYIYREYLPPLAAAIVDTRDAASQDAAGAKLARELNTEYQSVGAKSSKVLWAELSAMKVKLPSMMSPAERVCRKYIKGMEILDSKERKWILLDRLLNPSLYEWEQRVLNGSHLKLHGKVPILTKEEEQLAVLSGMEIDRILKAPWNLLERREIVNVILTIVTKYHILKSNQSMIYDRLGGKI